MNFLDSASSNKDVNIGFLTTCTCRIMKMITNLLRSTQSSQQIEQIQLLCCCHFAAKTVIIELCFAASF
eukprot:g69152.t1